MRLRTKFTWFAVLIHVLLIALSVLLYSTSKYLFVAAEIILLVSVIVTFQLYRAFLKPLDILSAGVESIRDRDFSTTFRPTGQEELDRLIAVYNGMIEQLRAERVRQREQHYFLQRLIDASPIGIIILDLDDRINMLNPAACSILGTTPDAVTGGPITQFTTVPGSELGGMSDGETRIVSVSGIRSYKCRVSHFVDRGFHRRFLMIEELTAEILSAQKRAYDKVIRMMSHEINNSVGAVNSILDSLLHYASQLTPEDRVDFENAVSVAVDRNNGLNRFMANFADVVRIPPPTRTPYDVCELLRSVQILMHAECTRRNIAWESSASDQSFIVNIDVEQMQQVLVNIVKNAIEAIGKNGRITIDVSVGKGVLRIVDTGRGISSDDKPYLFTPFFSTKRDGQGIGLTLIREILTNHECEFALQTNDDGLTEFRIQFATPADTSLMT
ncbi:MAG: PAS domain-containing protein [candidate division Zixibacteria bacterium]|nr:PAS domain-containing protein [candidate division Zixibacteria bacterium]